MRPITSIVVHCSDSPDDMDIGADEIRRWHVEERRFTDIGYHFVLKRSGKVELGRHLATQGAHCHGHNKLSIGICWVGRDDCTGAQWRALVKLCRGLMGRYGLKPDQIHGHGELDPKKTCPRIPMDRLRKDLGA